MNLPSWYFFGYYLPNKSLFPIQMISFYDLRNTMNNAFKGYFQAYSCNSVDLDLINFIYSHNF